MDSDSGYFGTVTVTAMQHGNKNYNAAEPVVVTFLVDDEYLSVDNEKITVTDYIEVYRDCLPIL